jgi:DNA recombination protein RmuC
MENMIITIVVVFTFFLQRQKYYLYQEFAQLQELIKILLLEQRNMIDVRQLESLKTLQNSLLVSQQDARSQIFQSLHQTTEQLSLQFDKLNQQVEIRLREISQQVDKRLESGFEKTTETFGDVIKRLAIIDEAQKRISDLSSDVIGLKDILNDKKARGAFGEVQLSALIRNVMPEKTFAFQYTLSNDKRADCILFLPSPTGHIVIDAKFPLENYRRLQEKELEDTQRKQIVQQFRQDVKIHIQAISEKYIIPGETADGAILFMPAESIFAEIHAYYPELIEEAHKRRVWLTSPTTLMAILTTARAAIKDADTRKQVHVMQEHLSVLAKDFDRFNKRMNNLARHIEQASEDVKEVHITASKITTRFVRIEQVELEEKVEEA